MSKEQVSLTPQLIERINSLQVEGNAEGALKVIRKAINCAACADEYESAEFRIDLIQELMWIEDIFRDFVLTKEKGDAQ